MMKQASVARNPPGDCWACRGVGAGPTPARFDGGIGVVPASNVAVNATTGAVTVTRNIVRGGDPPGQIRRLPILRPTLIRTAASKSEVAVCCSGAAAASAQNANQSVLATLICEAAAPFTLHNTDAAGVPLSQRWISEIDDRQPIPSVSSDCASPALSF